MMTEALQTVFGAILFMAGCIVVLMGIAGVILLVIFIKALLESWR